MDDFLWSDDDDSAQETFRHFTRDELEKIEQKIFDKKLAARKKAERREKNIQVGGNIIRNNLNQTL
jgi:hypothetical protein